MRLDGVPPCNGSLFRHFCNAAIGIGYDRLNRVLRKQYSDSTPPVTYSYDTATNGKGLLRSISNSESASNYTAYDKLGRVTARSQVTAGVTYPMSYGWDIAGNMRSMTLPSERTLTWSYDNAARATGVTGTKAGEANRTYASEMSYAAHGGLAGVAMGNGLTETWAYNSRMQPRQVSAVRSGTTQLGLGFYYCGPQVHTCGDNNGNPRIETIAIPGKAWTRSFGYDGWNRVSTASEGSDYRNFGYSPTGNMQKRDSHLDCTLRLRHGTPENQGQLDSPTIGSLCGAARSALSPVGLLPLTSTPSPIGSESLPGWRKALLW